MRPIAANRLRILVLLATLAYIFLFVQALHALVWDYSVSEREMIEANREISDIKKKLHEFDRDPVSRAKVCPELKKMVIYLVGKYSDHPEMLEFPAELMHVAACQLNDEVLGLRAEIANVAGADAQEKRLELKKKVSALARGLAKQEAEALEGGLAEFDKLSTELLAHKVYLAALCFYAGHVDYREKPSPEDKKYLRKGATIIRELSDSESPVFKLYGIVMRKVVPNFYDRELDLSSLILSWDRLEQLIIENFPNSVLAAKAQLSAFSQGAINCHGLQGKTLQKCSARAQAEVLKSYKYFNFPLRLQNRTGHFDGYSYSSIEHMRYGLFWLRHQREGLPDLWPLSGHRDPRNTLLGVPGTFERVPPLTGDETLQEILRLNETPPPDYELADIIRDNELAKKAFAEAGWKYNPDDVGGPEPFRMTRSVTAPINRLYQPMKPGSPKFCDAYPGVIKKVAISLLLVAVIMIVVLVVIRRKKTVL